MKKKPKLVLARTSRIAEVAKTELDQVVGGKSDVPKVVDGRTPVAPHEDYN